ncbi:sporulation protein [Tepidibacter hydrothermalis]|uniref:Sporulation protein n=1 Tax=Tepidibacter hydrothermalis TaxID=3036126 RepID=A0ABY8EG44_9FIRM|nr:sporulation protein [Tepidibacter hydrothermalis]WFD10724.1 sporulation protein [Tepidibacter hydrothermalis]
MGILSSIGLGNTKVNFKLNSNELTPGSKVNATLYIEGVSYEYYIENIFIKVITKHTQIKSDTQHITSNIAAKAKHVIQNIEVPINETIKANQSVEKNIEFVLDIETPITISKSEVWIEVCVENSIFNKRYDVKVNPHPFSAKILDSIEEIGFSIDKVYNDCFYGVKEGVPFVQWFVYTPNKEIREKFEQIRIAYLIEAEGVRLLVELDNMAKGIKGAVKTLLNVDAQEERMNICFTKEEINMGKEYIKNKLIESILSQTRI